MCLQRSAQIGQLCPGRFGYTSALRSRARRRSRPIMFSTRAYMRQAFNHMLHQSISFSHHLSSLSLAPLSLLSCLPLFLSLLPLSALYLPSSVSPSHVPLSPSLSPLSPSAISFSPPSLPSPSSSPVSLLSCLSLFLSLPSLPLSHVRIFG